MANHFIVPAPGQQLAPVVRRVQTIAKSVGENFRIDKSMPSPRLVVGEKTIQRWHELNAQRRAADVEAKAAVAARRAEQLAAAREVAEALSAPVTEEPAEPEAEEPDDAEPEAEVPVAKKAAVKKSAPPAKKRKSPSTK